MNGKDKDTHFLICKSEKKNVAYFLDEINDETKQLRLIKSIP